MSKLTVVLDPAHTIDYNKGVIDGYYEGNRMWLLTQYLKEELEKYADVEVLLTKNSLEENPTAYRRGEFAAKLENREKVVFLSLHTNALTGDKADITRGTVVFRSIHKSDNEELGEKIALSVAAVMNAETKVSYSRGCLAWEHPTVENVDYFAVLRGAVLSADSEEDAKRSSVDYGYIVEHGFHTHPAECEALMKDSVLQKIAKAEAKLLADYFNLSLIQTQPVPTPEPEKFYRVQVGAYLEKENAEAMLQRLNESGFEGFIVEVTQ